MTKNDKTIAELENQLEEIVSWFESSEVSVDKAAEKYEEAQKIIGQIETKLKSAETEIKKVQKKFS